ncbi:endoglucanase 1 [Mycena leptocephala]|nr:endoglucanase 1 [Mycena leptocephala]
MLLSFLTPYIFLCAVWAKILYAGVNESGGEFGVFSSNGTVGTGLPGRFGVDYAFINKSTVDIFVDQEKINFFRVTFLMERMCPLSLEYADAINHITLTKGAYALLDPHNYMRYKYVIGNTSDPTAATTQQFEQFWHQLALRFVSNPKVVFGINNEPHDMPTDLRTPTHPGSGNGFTGGHAWTQFTGAAGDAPSSDFLNKLVDPVKNTAMDIHEYLDIDFSGGHAECTQPERMSEFGEVTMKIVSRCVLVIWWYGVPNFMIASRRSLKYLAANDEWIGWTIWAAGPIWGTASPCCGSDTGSLEPGNLNIWANLSKFNVGARWHPCLNSPHLVRSRRSGRIQFAKHPEK